MSGKTWNPLFCVAHSKQEGPVISQKWILKNLASYSGVSTKKAKKIAGEWKRKIT